MLTIRLFTLAALISYPMWAASFSYDVMVDTNLTGPQASLLLTLFDNDIPAATSVAVTDVEGIVSEGFTIQSGNVSGSLAGDDLVISDGAPANQYINGLLEIGATFGPVLSLHLEFDTAPVPNNDLFVFAMRGWWGGVIDLFTFTGLEEVTVYEHEFVTIYPSQPVAVSESSPIAEWALLFFGMAALLVRRSRTTTQGPSAVK